MFVSNNSYYLEIGDRHRMGARDRIVLCCSIGPSGDPGVTLGFQRMMTVTPFSWPSKKKKDDDAPRVYEAWVDLWHTSLWGYDLRERCQREELPWVAYEMVKMQALSPTSEGAHIVFWMLFAAPGRIPDELRELAPGWAEGLDRLAQMKDEFEAIEPEEDDDELG